MEVTDCDFCQTLTRIRCGNRYFSAVRNLLATSMLHF
jgi:hypothetical protein